MTVVFHSITLYNLFNCPFYITQQYTFISYYWHMHLNKHACHILCICSTALLVWSIYVPHIILYKSKRNNIYVPTTNVPLKFHISATYSN